jgi:hypothetical protein
MKKRNAITQSDAPGWLKNVRREWKEYYELTATVYVVLPYYYFQPRDSLIVRGFIL